MIICRGKTIPAARRGSFSALLTTTEVFNMNKYQGKGVYGAIAIGKISVFRKRDADVKRVHVSDT